MIAVVIEGRLELKITEVPTACNLGGLGPIGGKGGIRRCPFI